MFCSKCQKAVRDSAKFCPHCGTPAANNAANGNISSEASDTSDASVRYITIAASGDKPEVHTILLDDKYPYHVANGELVKLPVSGNTHKFVWTPPLTFPPSLPSTMQTGRNKLFFKIEKKKRFLGIANYVIDSVESEQDLNGLFSSRRECNPWPTEVYECVNGDGKYAIIYDDKMIIVGKDDVRNEIKYEELMSVECMPFLMLYYWDEKETNEKKHGGIPIKEIALLSEKTLKYINSRIHEIRNDGVYTCKHNANGRGVIIYDDKIVFINEDGFHEEYVYDSLMSVKNNGKSIFLYYWNKEGLTKEMPTNLDLKDIVFDYINERIANSHGAHVCIKGDGEWTCIVYDDKMVMISTDGTRREFNYISLLKIDCKFDILTVYHNDAPDDASDKYESVPMKKSVMHYINEKICESRTDGFHKFIIGKKHKFFLYTDRIIIISNKTGKCKEIKYDKIDFIRRRKNLGDSFILRYWDNNVITSDEYSSIDYDDKSIIINYINSRINTLNKEKGIDVFVSPADNSVKLEFNREKNWFHIQRGEKISPDYPISGIVKCDTKSFEKEGENVAVSALRGAALHGMIGGTYGAMFGALHGARTAKSSEISRIEIWLTIQFDNRTVEEKIIMFDAENVENKNYAFNKLEKLQSYLESVTYTSAYNPVSDISETSDAAVSLPETDNDAITEMASSGSSQTSSMGAVILATDKLTDSPHPAPPQNDAKSAIAELREWKSLLDDGIITEEEFAAKKKQLMNL